MNATYEQLREQAQTQSKQLNRFCAVVRSGSLMSENQNFTLVTGVFRIQHMARNGFFREVICQFHNGKPV